MNAVANADALSATAHQAAIEAELRRAPVVLFRSPLTDMRALTERLRQAGVDFHEVVLGMASYAMRERFHVLQAQTGWSTLPLVFVGGRFIGGIDELLRHPLLAGEGTASCASARSDVKRRARQLGWFGLLPFVAGAVLPWLIDDAVVRAALLELTLAYAAVILSFVGAVHWGRALSGTPSPVAWLGYSVVPALAGWLMWAVGGPLGLIGMAGAFAAAYWFDRKAYRTDPDLGWFLLMRGQITAAVIAMLFVGAVAHGLSQGVAS